MKYDILKEIDKHNIMRDAKYVLDRIQYVQDLRKVSKPRYYETMHYQRFPKQGIKYEYTRCWNDLAESRITFQCLEITGSHDILVCTKKGFKPIACKETKIFSSLWTWLGVEELR